MTIKQAKALKAGDILQPRFNEFHYFLVIETLPNGVNYQARARHPVLRASEAIRGQRTTHFVNWDEDNWEELKRIS